MSHDVQEVVKGSIDIVAATATVGVVAELITPIAAIFTLVWTVLRLYVMVIKRIQTGKWY